MHPHGSPTGPEHRSARGRIVVAVRGYGAAFTRPGAPVAPCQPFAPVAPVATKQLSLTDTGYKV